MDSREVPIPSQLQPMSSAMFMGHSSYHSGDRISSAMISPNSTSPANHHASVDVRLPYGSLAPHQHQHWQLHQQLPSPPTQQQEPKTVDSLRFDGSPSSAQSPMNFGSVEQHTQVKKKRGRPRKYAADGNIALGLAPTTQLPSSSNSYGGGGEAAGSGGGLNEVNSSDRPAKRSRGRPRGSGKKQLDALGGIGGIGFTPHVIEVKAGEDIAAKIMSFSQQSPRTICVLSACGTISNVTLRQQAMSNDTVKYEGRFEIVSLSGSFLHSENNGSISKSGSLSVSLAGADRQILGGGVAGVLVAGSPVQVIVGSFITERKKAKLNASPAVNTEPSSEPPNMLSFGGPTIPANPHSQVSASESSEEHGSGSGSHNHQQLQQNHHHQPQQNHRPQPQYNHHHHRHGIFGHSAQPPLPMPMNHLWNGHNPMK